MSKDRKSYWRDLRDALRGAGKCTACRKRRSLRGRTRCKPCLALMRARYLANKEAGKCLHCSKDREPGFSTCERCHAKAPETHRRARRRCIENGLCIDCYQPTEGMGQRCGGCLLDIKFGNQFGSRTFMKKKVAR